MVSKQVFEKAQLSMVTGFLALFALNVPSIEYPGGASFSLWNVFPNFWTSFPSVSGFTWNFMGYALPFLLIIMTAIYCSYEGKKQCETILVSILSATSIVSIVGFVVAPMAILIIHGGIENLGELLYASKGSFVSMALFVMALRAKYALMERA